MIRLGISTCPNDTFAFHGLLSGQVDRRGLEITVDLLDVEELNRRLFAGDMDVAKASFHTALLLASEVCVLPSGSALGFGVGPVLLAARDRRQPTDRIDGREARVLCPGAHTTATLLYRMFHPGAGQVVQAVFSDIMPALERGTADFGVCIHEGRFTYAARGLRLVEDLGATWETLTGEPLPLGGIVARRRLGRERLGQIQAIIRDSIAYGLAHRAETLPTMRRYAQELDDEVLLAHVDLYVSDATLDLGASGRRALAKLAERAARAGALDPRSAGQLTVLDCG